MIKKVLILILLVLILVFVGVFVVKNSTQPVSDVETLQDFLITKGSGATKIGNDLKNQGLIKNSLAFKVYVQLTGRQGKISAGEFRLSPNMNLIQVVETLQKGPVEMWVTIPEGLRHEEIARRFAESLGKDDEFVREFIDLAQSSEGNLFPETYLFPKSTTPQKVVEKMLSTYKLKTGDQPTDDQLIVASLIERETKGDDEKPIVAGILYKRIENGWPLQVDATIQYAKGDWKSILSTDKELNSAYNTYKYQGLPPGPICNPGLASIEAAINPEGSDYWYYLHDEKGVIHYAKNLDEHNTNIRQYLY